MDYHLWFCFYFDFTLRAILLSVLHKERKATFFYTHWNCYYSILHGSLE